MTRTLGDLLRATEMTPSSLDEEHLGSPSRESSPGQDPPRTSRGRDSTPPIDPELESPSVPTREETAGSSHTPSSRKRYASDVEDMIAAVPHVTQRLRLNSENERSLEDYAKMPSEYREAFLVGHILQITQFIGRMQPAEAVYQPDPKLCIKLTIYAHQILICPIIRGYREEATTMLMDIVTDHPQWGYTEEIRADDRKSKIILGLAQDGLTKSRAVIKACLVKSLGSIDLENPEGPRKDAMDIVKLTKACISSLDTARVVTHKTKPNIAMCTRFAFLRTKIEKNNHKDFWKVIDKDLVALRSNYKNSPDQLTQYFNRVLEDDLKVYGDTSDILEVIKATKHTQQIEVEKYASGEKGSNRR